MTTDEKQDSRVLEYEEDGDYTITFSMRIPSEDDDAE